MLIASKLIASVSGLAPVLVRRAATLALDWDTRQKSRFEGVDSHGRSVAVFLPRGQVVRGGDVLIAEDGSLIAMTALPQPVLRVTAGAEGSPLDLLRAAYHLGNRHVPLEVKPGHLQLEPDHVLAEMLRRMGLHLEAGHAAFEPEAGAYDAAQPARGDGHVDGHGHVHGPACDHDPGHGYGHGSHDHARAHRDRDHDDDDDEAHP